MLKLLIVDDEYLVRDGIRETIDWRAQGVEIVGEADNGEDGLELALAHNPDVIVTDVRMPFMNGLEMIEKLKAHGLAAGIVVLSGYDEFQYAQAAIRHGASAYLLKPVDTSELAATVGRIGADTQLHKREQVEFHKLREELPAIAKQMWLDLLQGALDEAGIAAKRSLLPARPAGTKYVPIVLEPKQRIAELEPRITQSQLEINLEAHSMMLEVALETGASQWSLILSGDSPWEKWLPRIRQFGQAIVACARQEHAGEFVVGIGTAADSLSELARAARQAHAAAARAAGSFGGVWYAEDREEATRREIRGALAYIREHYAENLTVEIVASEVYVSPTHLMHLFRKELNKTFYECLTECRIEAAKIMLRDPQYRVYEVSGRTGFGDAKYFSQIFKKMTGKTPSEYARTES